jgi:hypothetical protein
MYGQTEATARMAYLPPELARSRPQAIGVPIPGGAFRLDPLPEPADPDTGELVYSGPNVMLGYADGPADLGLGRTFDELHTGDIARRADDGLYEIVGRRGQFLKIFGLRIDPHEVEAALARRGVSALCTGTDRELVVAARDDLDSAYVRRLVTAACGLPPGAVRVLGLAELPRLPSGKPDRRAVLDRATAAPATTPAAVAGPVSIPHQRDRPRTDLRDLYAEILDRDDVTEDSSFVSLGGDSLSYVEMSVRLERVLGHLPPNWHTRPIRDLRPPERASDSRRRALETSVALRAAAIVLVVGTHAGLFNVSGGAHLLLGVAGFNFARFHLIDARRRERLRHVWSSIARLAVPSVAWIAAMLVLTDDYGPASLFLLHSVAGPEDGAGWHFWFIEALVYVLVATAVLLAVPAVDRIERRWPYWLPMAIVALGLVTRYDLLGLRARFDVPSAVLVFWLFGLGWAAAKATSTRHRLVVSAAALATVPGFFADPKREAVIVAGLALLIWVPTLPSLGTVNRVAGVLAASSLFIYLTHWQVYPHLDHHNALVAVAVSLVAGIACAAVATAVGPLRAARLRLPGWRRRRPGGGAASPGRGATRAG